MLILTRRPGEDILIGEEVVVRVIAVNGTSVKIGVEAPKDVPVDRREVKERESRD